MAITRRDMGSRSRSPATRGRRTGVDLGSLYQVGAKVEVSSNEDGFRGAWYSASIYGPPRRSLRNCGGSGSGCVSGVLVEYETLLSEANQSQFLIEFIELPFVRPVPPGEEGNAASFQPHDVVDAFHRDGWWKGVVSTVVDRPGGENGNGERLYNVVFQDPCHQLRFRASKLRFHLEWANGSWTKPTKQKRMKGLTFSKGMEVEVNLENNSSEEVWYPATIVDEVGFCSFSVTCKSMESDVASSPVKATVDCFHIRPLPPRVDIRSFSLLESVYALYDSGWRPGFIIEVISKEVFTVCMQNDMVEKELSLLDIRPYLYWKDGKWVSYSRNASHSEVNSELAEENAIKLLGASPGNGTTEKHCPKLLSSCSKSERKGVKRSSPGSGARHLRSPKKSKRRNSNDSAFSPQSVTDLQLADVSIQMEVSSNAEINLWKGIDRNSRNEGKDQHVPGAGVTIIDDDIHTSKIRELALIAHRPAGVTEGVTNDIENQDLAIKEVELPMIAYGDHSVPFVCAVDLINQYSAVEVVEPLMITCGASDMDDQHSAVQEGDLPMLTCDEPVDEECNEPEVAVGEMDDEVDMVQDFEPPMITGEKPAGESLCDGGKLCEQPSKGHRGLALVTADGIPPELVENAENSFVKASPVWKTIESMEPFQLLPQKPHFRPLVNCFEENQEAVAISAMILFSNLVERTSKLQVNDPSVLFERYLGSLSDLDSFGFDVKPVVERIEKLLEIKEKRGEFQDSSKQLQLKIADNETEISNLAEAIDVAERKIKELEEKRASDAAMVSMIEAEIATLHSDAIALEENVTKAEQEFRSVVASPW